MSPFEKSDKPSVPLHGRHLAAGEKPAKTSRSDAQEGASVSMADAVQLRDADPVLSFTAPEQMRNQDAKYVMLWPSDLPRKRR